MNAPAKLLYRNYKGLTRLREVIPLRIWYGHTEYHPTDQWLLDVLDLDKDAERTFACKDILQWE